MKIYTVICWEVDLESSRWPNIKILANYKNLDDAKARLKKEALSLIEESSHEIFTCNSRVCKEKEAEQDARDFKEEEIQKLSKNPMLYEIEDCWDPNHCCAIEIQESEVI